MRPSLPPAGGNVKICGADTGEAPDASKKALGVVFQSSLLDAPLTVYENLKSRAALYGIYGSDFKKRVSELSELLGLDELLKRPVGKLSGGQRRRIDIARALIHKPRILILDEPTTGLDPQTRANVWEVVQRLRREDGMTIFLTTHYMEEATDADNVLILERGKIAAQGTPLELKNRYTGDFITVYGASEEEMRTLGVGYTAQKEGYRITVESTAQATELICAHPEIFRDYEIKKGGMDDVFLAATGCKLTGGNE